MKVRLVIILLFIILLQGCGEPNIIEDLGFMHSVAYDLNTENPTEEGRLIITIDTPQVDQTAEDLREVLTTKAHALKEGTSNIARKSDRKLVAGQLRSVLFNQDLAKEGIMPIINSLDRDSHIGLHVKVIVVEGGTGKELLFEEYSRHPRTSRYLHDLIDKEADQSVVIGTSLYQFSRDYYDDGIDPVCPIIKKGENEIIIDGIALFREDKYVNKLTPDESLFFHMLYSDYEEKNVYFNIALEDEDDVFTSFSVLEVRPKFIVTSPDVLEINLQVKGIIEEYSGTSDLSVREPKMKLENQLEEYIQKKSQNVITKLQQFGVDSIGFGTYVRNSVRYSEWKEMNWIESIYPDAQITVNTEVRIKGTGSIK
ncbi:Ger(x)C family spore germination protein [Evansella sp. AB-rgal1]|uniref:Ger(x)C family spore germination protein n=1 Tax=Evansella sp. AB-rgal1 TaxID=3242696 RepID=UPI00359D21C7